MSVETDKLDAIYGRFKAHCSHNGEFYVAITYIVKKERTNFGYGLNGCVLLQGCKAAALLQPGSGSALVGAHRCSGLHMDLAIAQDGGRRCKLP